MWPPLRKEPPDDKRLPGSCEQLSPAAHRPGPAVLEPVTVSLVQEPQPRRLRHRLPCCPALPVWPCSGHTPRQSTLAPQVQGLPQQNRLAAPAEAVSSQQVWRAQTDRVSGSCPPCPLMGAASWLQLVGMGRSPSRGRTRITSHFSSSPLAENKMKTAPFVELRTEV